MKIGFDVSPLKDENKFRGVGSYTQNLLESLKKLEELEVQEFTDLKQLKNVDLVHLPYFDFFKHTLPIQKKFPTVITIHDITPLLFPKEYPLGIKGKFNLRFQKLALKNTKGIITVSESAKKDITRYFNFNTKKIYSIPEAASKYFKVINNKDTLKNIKNKYDLPDKFALYTGNVNWNKNIINLTKACIDSGLDLALVGKSFTKRENLNHPELRSFKQFLEKFEKNPKVHILGFVPTEDLVKIYNLAEMFLFPSFYEGFGLPILEAQACGVPVITSNVSSMPETAGDGALFVDPYNIESIKDAINSIVDNKELQNKLKIYGFKNIEKYSWEKTAKLTKDAYIKSLNL